MKVQYELFGLGASPIESYLLLLQLIISFNIEVHFFDVELSSFIIIGLEKWSKLVFSRFQN